MTTRRMANPRQRDIRKIGGPIVAVIAAVAMALPPAWVAAHGGELELSVSTDQIAAGDTLVVSGGGFSPGATVALHLSGPNGDGEIGSADVDDEGDFVQQVTIPGDTAPGPYLVRSEGDREASTELTVGAMPGMGSTRVAADPVRDRPAMWAWGVGGVAVVLAAAGLALARTGSWRPSGATART